MADAAVPLKEGRFQSILDPIGWLLQSFHAELVKEPAGLQPRWARIAAGRALGPGHGLVEVIRWSVEVMFKLASLAHELVFAIDNVFTSLETQRAQALSIFTDIRSVLSTSNLQTLTTAFPALTKVVKVVEDALGYVERAIDLWPTADDLLMLGNKIYALLAIKPNPRPTGLMLATPPPAVDLAGTGPLRLLQWAYDADYPLRGLGPCENPREETARISRFGSRWLWETENQKLPPVSRAVWAWAGAGSRTEVVYEHLFNEGEPDTLRRTRDLVDLHEILEKLGYFAGPVRPDLRHQWHPALSQAIEVFQAVNDLPRTKELDSATLNRMLHLDVVGQTVKRALPLDTKTWSRVKTPPPLPPIEILVRQERQVPVTVEVPGTITGQVSGLLPLVNPDANSPAEEAIPIETGSLPQQDVTPSQLQARRAYRYYRCGRTPENGKVNFGMLVGRGWIQHSGEADPVDGEPVQGGFTALESRDWREADGTYEGGEGSEGATGNGPFFFAARHQSPSVAGRKGAAIPPIWQPISLEKGARTGMYQWVDLASQYGICTVGENLKLTGSVSMRVWIPGSGETASGRLVLALVPRAAWEKEKYATIFDRSQILKVEGASAVATTDWFPDDTPDRLSTWQKKIAEDRRQRGSLSKLWIERTAELNITVTADAPILYVGLHGRSPGGEDVHAWFDEVRVKWERGSGGAPNAAKVAAQEANDIAWWLLSAAAAPRATSTNAGSPS